MAVKYFDIPLCLVDGFMSPYSLDVFQHFISWMKLHLAKNDQSCPMIIKSFGCGAASGYDCVMDLFYQLKGGQVDYGEVHSKKHRHRRYGKSYAKGHYELWSEENPINFLTHSFGGNVVLLMQTLLEQQVFYDSDGNRYNTNANWVRSIATVSSPLRGTLCNYHMGHHPFKAHMLTPFTFKKWVHFGVYFWEYFDSPLLKACSLLDFKMPHFDISYRHVSFFDLIKNILSDSCPELIYDTSSYDISIERYLNKPTKTFDKTYYRSYAATLTEPITNSEDNHLNSIHHWCLYLVHIATKTGSTPLNVYPQLNKEDVAGWKSNDGICSLISQLHPEPCSERHCQHTALMETEKFSAGKWYSTTIQKCSHVDLVPGFHPPSKPTSYFLKLLNMTSFTRLTTSETFWDKDYLVSTLDDVAQDYANFLTNTEYL